MNQPPFGIMILAAAAPQRKVMPLSGSPVSVIVTLARGISEFLSRLNIESVRRKDSPEFLTLLPT
jgi:hypothetical protein